MKKIYKDTFREMKKSLGRFVSIFAIVAIGVAFFAGVRASAPLMKETADQYYDDYNLMDITLYSTLGFVEEDVEAIADIEGVEGITATHSVDVLFQVGTNQHAYKVMTLPKNADADDPNYINQAVLIEGRLPENVNECVIEDANNMMDLGLEVGDKIQLSSGTEDPLEDTLASTELEIVGIVRNPYYLSYQKGSTNIGNGSLDGYLMVLEEAFTSDIYTEIYLTVQGAKDVNSYDDEYFEKYIDPVTDKLDSLGGVRASLRTQEVKQEAEAEYNDGMQEYLDAKEEAETEIADAQQELVNAYNDLIQAERDVAQAEIDLEEQLTEGRQEIEDGRQEIEDAKAELESAQEELDTNRETALAAMEQLIAGIDEINANIDEIDTMSEDLNQQLEDEDLSSLEIRMIETQLTELERTREQLTAQLEPLQAQYDEAMAPINEAQQTIDDGWAEIESNEQLLAESEQDLIDGEAEGRQEIADARADIAEGWAEYYDGTQELEDNRRIAEEELADAREELEQAEADILAIDDCEWIVLDRESHYSYMDYGSAADRMEAIAQIFPLFFFLVAALICLTTMTRMVDEQRETIGTLKALGYSKLSIANKFLIYAFTSSAAGCVVGSVVGFAIFPLVIFNAWNIMYSLPSAHFTFYPELALIASLSNILITLIATMFAVYKELMETPALLMRPKAPKNGKRIFLERIPFLWKHFSFSMKVTARNLIRYKKRFFMTVIGISGCSALLVAGFGIQDSIGNIVSQQYEVIQNYDINIELEDDLNVVQREDVLEEISALEDIDEITTISEFSGEVFVKNKDQSVTIMVPSDPETFANFHLLRNRVTGEVYELQNTGALISEKMANDLNIGVGDTFEIERDDVTKQITVNGVIENYVGHLVVMSQDAFRSTYGNTPKPTNVYAKSEGIDDVIEDRVGTQLMEIEHVDSISFYRGSAETFANTISSISMIVVVLVVAAGVLAFVVLYNLTNVNISERIREIATIKVLGFYDKEVSNYVFRENLILSFIGALVGLLLGTVLHRLIMNLAELDNVMFGRVISPTSYLLGIVITMFFSWLITKFMHYKLVKIKMVESLKSVE